MTAAVGFRTFCVKAGFIYGMGAGSQKKQYHQKKSTAHQANSFFHIFFPV
jgi:hypothetical protein